MAPLPGHDLNFNPRPPCGGRRDGQTKTRKADAFQSTSSVWRTTKCATEAQRDRAISIHVLRVEDDIPLL